MAKLERIKRAIFGQRKVVVTEKLAEISKEVTDQIIAAKPMVVKPVEELEK